MTVRIVRTITGIQLKTMAMVVGSALLLAACSFHEINRHESVVAPASESSSASMDYLVYLPVGYDSSEHPNADWPVLFFLHGIMQTGHDLRMLPKYGPAQQIEAGRDFPFIVITPQMSSWWWNADETVAFIEDCIERYRIDPSRVYLSGVSLGGRGVWSVAAARPELFAAIAPVAGWGDEREAVATANIPAWIFHGRKDPLIRASAAEKMYLARAEAGGNAALTVYPDAGHAIWNEVYAADSLYDWFLSHSLDSRVVQN